MNGEREVSEKSEIPKEELREKREERSIEKITQEIMERIGRKNMEEGKKKIKESK